LSFAVRIGAWRAWRTVVVVKVLRALVVLVAVVGAVAGTAGLSSLRSGDGCADQWQFAEGSTLGAIQRVSLWPLGVACRLVDANGTVFDEVGASVWGFLALLALEIGLLVFVLRSRTPKPLALRAAASATAGLLVWGICSLWLGAVAGLTVSVLYLLGPVAGFVVDRRLRRAGDEACRRTDGLLGLFVAPAAAIFGLFVWLLIFGPLAHVVTIALVAVVAGIVGLALKQRGSAVAIVVGLAVALVLGPTLVMTGSAVELSCTLVGCTSGVSVRAPDLAYARDDVSRVRVCIYRNCSVLRRDRGVRWQWYQRIADRRIVIAVSAAMLDERGRVISSHSRPVTRRPTSPNGRRCGPTCYVGGVVLDARGRLGAPAGEFGLRMPPAVLGQPRADVIGGGRVRRLGGRMTPPRPLAVRRDDELQVRTDARSYVRVFAPGRLPSAEPLPFELAEDRAGRVWSVSVPSRLRGVRYLIVRLDHRKDRRIVELRLPITPVR
jgi:hypothetical protein